MIKVKNNSCLGCGLCAETCPTGAISIITKRAFIDPSKCIHCGLCLQVCPQRAIMDVELVSKEDLKNTVALLRQRTDEIILRIENLRRCRESKQGN